MAGMALQMSSGVFDPEQRVGERPAATPSVHLDGRRISSVGTARVYTCGITPYDVTHLGHAATFVWADVLASVIESTGVEVRSARNVTDVDDVLTAAAASRGRRYDELALAQESAFEHSMRELRVATPAAQPRARHHVPAVQQLAQALLDAGAAYERDGRVLFRGLAALERSGLPESEALGLARAYGDNPDDPAKDHRFDVDVWRPSGENDPAWPSPWGWGRPGWHAECAAMALAVHGASVDVLVGGDDLAFPHHAYQAAMVEAVTGVAPFARSVLHVGTVRINGDRMAKSTGNLVLVDDVLRDGWSPAQLRLALIDRPVNEPWDFDSLDRDAVSARLDGLYAAAAGGSATSADDVLEVLRSGLDVPGAIEAAVAAGGEAARRLIAVLRLG
jgi:cysteinyl-tRNA synthetase